jgi:hypothetical protein
VNSKNKNIRDLYRGINEFKRGYQTVLADSHNILNRWKNYSQLLNVQRLSVVRQIEIYIAEPSVPDPSFLRSKLLLKN